MKKLVGGTCLGLFLALTVSTAFAQSSLTARSGHCRSAIREYLVDRGVDPQEVVSIDLRADRRSLTAVDSLQRRRQIGWEAWARVKSCRQTLNFRVDQFCRVLSANVPSECRIASREGDPEPTEGLLDTIQQREDTK